MARTPKKWRYTVVGSHNFPIDMLRYDGAYPASEADSGQIAATYYPREMVASRNVQVIGERPPTIGRWESFGWRIIGDSVKELAF